MSHPRAILLVLILLLALAACSSPDPTPTTTPSGPASTPTASPTPVVSTPLVGEPGGSIVAITTADITHRDVHQDVSVTLASRGPGIAYSRLLRLRTGVDITQPSLLLECDLCQSWEMLDPLTYRFHLREGVRWQDIPPVNGRKLTAEDVVFSYQRQRTEGWVNSSLLLAMNTVEAEDDLTLRVTLKFPDTDFLLALADGRTKVVAREAAEALGELREGPVVGTGPWIWLRTEKGVGSEFEANPDYFEEGLPFARQLSFKVIKDPDTRVAAFLTGLVDVYDALPQEWTKLQAIGGEYQTVLSKEGGLGLVLAMNVSRPPFNDEDIRRAVFKALDPWAYLNDVWGGRGFVSSGVPVVESSWLLSRQEGEAFFTDSTTVERVLDDADTAFEFVLADFGDLYLEAGMRIERELREAGFDPSLKVLNPVEYSEQVWQRKDYQLFVGPVPPTSSPNSYLFSTLHSGGQWNLLAHRDSALDELIESQQELSFNSSERREAFQAIQRRLLDQAYMFGLGANGTLWVLQDGVRGFYPNTALSEYSYWAKTWLER